MPATSTSDFRLGFVQGAREACGVPGLLMSAGFIGFGSMASDAGATFVFAALATILMWALPGQVVMLDMMTVKATLFATLLAVFFSAVRFLPMTVTLGPQMRMAGNSGGGWRAYLAVQWVATTSWALAMQRYPNMPAAQRAPWMMGFGVVCTLVAVVCCAIGYFGADNFPRAIRIGHIFLMPAFFVILLAGDVRTRAMAASLVCGAIAGPALYLWSREWSVVLGGLIGGTVAYAAQKFWKGLPA